jgi:ketosteroid isomerase-like protein
MAPGASAIPASTLPTLDSTQRAADTGLAMSQDNVAVVERVWAAFNRRDADEATELVSPDFSFRSEFGAFSGRGYEGRAGFRQYFRDMAETWSAFRMELDEVVKRGDVVIVTYREHAIGRTSGVEVEARGCEVWHFRDGQPVRAENYGSKEEGLASVGLRE